MLRTFSSERVFRGPLSKWGPTLASADIRAQKRKRTVCSFPRLGLLRTAWAAGGARELKWDVLSSVHPLQPIREAVGTFWVGALPDAVCGRPGLAAFPQAQLSPLPTAARDLPAADLGQVCPEKVHRAQPGPTGVWRNGRPSGGKWWSAKSRNQNYTKGKTGRVHEAKTARKGFAFNAHSGLPSLSQEIILSSGAQCSTFAWSARGGLQSPGNSRQS